MNYALRLDNDLLMDEEDDVLIRTNMEMNMIIGNANNSGTTSNNKQSFEDDDIRELEQMVKYHEEEN